MVRSAATPRVSNHEAVGNIAGLSRQSTERRLLEAVIQAAPAR
jgi:hypothetical protein